MPSEKNASQKRWKFRLSKSELLLLLALCSKSLENEELVLFVLSLAVPGDSHPFPSIAKMGFFLEDFFHIDFLQAIHVECGLY